ncbi:hypothetical protein PR048_015740 [Dryococelus australis]|uniref:Ig-like domain-containing protein n=1 Tax=Dryococelus australis TaxID=614101 RepID=A0ABQ9HI43_9NEOP|nr:hypothetical protein PR048_015740 [Dryococelus australis]
MPKYFDNYFSILLYRISISKQDCREVRAALHVLAVPPDIVDEETSSDITVQEGDNATMTCRAVGHPAPRILWKREGGEELVFRLGPRNVTKGTVRKTPAFAVAFQQRSCSARVSMTYRTN